MVEYLDIIRIILISFTITIILGPVVIPLLKRHKIGQNVRDDGPETHLAKSGTPTMGGVIMLIALLITTMTSGMLNKDMYILLISTFGFGLIGFIDDYLKVANGRSLGLKPYQKNDWANSFGRNVGYLSVQYVYVRDQNNCSFFLVIDIWI